MVTRKCTAAQHVVAARSVSLTLAVLSAMLLAGAAMAARLSSPRMPAAVTLLSAEPWRYGKSQLLAARLWALASVKHKASRYSRMVGQVCCSAGTRGILRWMSGSGTKADAAASCGWTLVGPEPLCRCSLQ